MAGSKYYLYLIYKETFKNLGAEPSTQLAIVFFFFKEVERDTISENLRRLMYKIIIFGDRETSL